MPDALGEGELGGGLSVVRSTSTSTFGGRIQLVEYRPRVLERPPPHSTP